MANEFKVRKALVVTGPLTVTGNSAIGGSETIAGTLSVTGTSTLAGGISGTTNFSGNVNMAQNLVVTGDLTVSGSFSFAGGSVFPDNTFAVQGEFDATKEVAFLLGGATTGTKTTLVLNQTANRSIALPDASTTLVGHDTSQTLTNKAINASNNTITNIADANIAAAAAIAMNKLATITANRAVASDGSGFLVATAVTDTELGFLSGVTSQVVGISDTNTLTNKTISAGSNTISGLGDANIDSAAAIARSKLANGTAGHVVINNGGGAMSSEAQLASSRGGTGADLSAATGVAHFVAGTATTEAQLDETRGGTGISGYAAGDMLYASATDTLSKLGIGAPGQTLKTSNSNEPAWEDTVDPAREVRINEDWITTAAGSNNWTQIPGGAGVGSATTLSYDDGNTQGVVEFNTGTTATGFIHRTLGGVTTGAFTSGLQVGGGQVTVQSRVLIPTLSTGAEEFNFQVGLKAAYSGSTDHIVFTYNRATYGTNWQLITRSAGVDTVVDTGIAVTAGQWYNLRFVVNAAGSSVEAFIDGVSVGTSSTNIPTVSIAPIISLIKSVGTTARTAEVDFYRLYKRFTTSR